MGNIKFGQYRLRRSGPGNSPVKITVEVVQVNRRDKSVLVRGVKEKVEVWMPMAQCFFLSDESGKTVTMTCPKWMAKQKGLVK